MAETTVGIEYIQYFIQGIDLVLRVWHGEVTNRATGLSVDYAEIDTHTDHSPV